eukprot:CAMPEP_0178377642 /NCGR_PEP_ID=MMETSP0689_2-20121128/4022_1 /TAXON_ID=160604 /ORGANISM="Amphidinium massartii, Strain CS-259" /LENGTH=518 /DNA_ID=CAMNT_0019997699 /DNA_START=245 /DNA_END=1799 /DNA_ORIENTATION=-
MPQSSNRNGLLSWRFAEFLDTYAAAPEDLGTALRSLRQALAYKESQFAAPGQQDAYEFLGCLLDGLEEDSKTFRSEGRFPAGRSIGIHNLFGVKTFTSRTCQRCANKFNVDFVTDTVLRLPLVTDAAHADEVVRLREEGSEVPLKDVLMSLQREEVIEGYDCDSCKARAARLGMRHERSSMVQQAHILSSTSDILVLALFRFINTCDPYGRIGAVKVKRRVRIPPQLNCSTGEYSLYGIVSHIGSDISHGHYVAVVKDHHQHEWCYCDDATVSVVADPTTGLAPSSPGDPFILFYHRTKAPPPLNYQTPSRSSTASTQAARGSMQPLNSRPQEQRQWPPPMGAMSDSYQRAPPLTPTSAAGALAATRDFSWQLPPGNAGAHPHHSSGLNGGMGSSQRSRSSAATTSWRTNTLQDPPHHASYRSDAHMAGFSGSNHLAGSYSTGGGSLHTSQPMPLNQRDLYTNQGSLDTLTTCRQLLTCPQGCTGPQDPQLRQFRRSMQVFLVLYHIMDSKIDNFQRK